MKIITVLVILILSLPASAASYKIDYEKSSLNFSGKHAGKEFKGTFKKWQADIIFDATDLASSKITATFETKSANTGNVLYDRTLPQVDWFNIAEYPSATFTSKTITTNEDGTYKAEGTLKLRNIEKPFTFNFTLKDPGKEVVSAKASFKINRLEFDIGKQSDPNAEWVSKEISMDLNLTASK